MSYESAPATRMLATQCACCGKPLVDAKSVEAGVGPDCRKKHGYGVPQAEPDWPLVLAELDGVASVAEVNPEVGSHRSANLLVHRIATRQSGWDVVAMIAALHALGFRALAARCAERLGAIRVTRENGKLCVKSPYSVAFLDNVRRCRGVQWIGARQVRLVPESERANLWAAIRESFPAGTIVVGDRVTVITAGAA